MEGTVIRHLFGPVEYGNTKLIDVLDISWQIKRPEKSLDWLYSARANLRSVRLNLGI